MSSLAAIQRDLGAVTTSLFTGANQLGLVDRSSPGTAQVNVNAARGSHDQTIELGIESGETLYWISGADLTAAGVTLTSTYRAIVAGKEYALRAIQDTGAGPPSSSADDADVLVGIAVRHG